MDTNISTKIGITFFVFLVLLFLVSCNDTSSTSTPKDSNANKSLTANDKQNVQLNQSNSMNSAPQIISNAGNASVTNKAQPIQQANGNTSVYTAPVQSSKSISYKDLISMFADSPNNLAGEEKLKDFFGNQSIIVRNVPVFQVTRNDEGQLLIQGFDMETFGITTVFAVDEKDKQKILSIKSPGNFFEQDKINIRCTYDQIDRADNNLVRLWFYFVSIE